MDVGTFGDTTAGRSRRPHVRTRINNLTPQKTTFQSPRDATDHEYVCSQ
jgi:hypothetical protein